MNTGSAPNPYDPIIVGDDIPYRPPLGLVLAFLALLFGLVVLIVVLIAAVELANRGQNVLPQTWPGFAFAAICSGFGVWCSVSGSKDFFSGCSTKRGWLTLALALSLGLLVGIAFAVNFVIVRTLTG